MSEITFRYSAADDAGKILRGVIHARGRTDAYHQLTSRGLTPTELVERSGVGPRFSLRRIPPMAIVEFTHELAALMEAGIVIVDGLRSMASGTEGGPLQRLINQVAGDIEGGARISEALEKHRDVLGSVYVESIRAAESSGNMTKVLRDLADMLESQIELRQQIKKALTYPALVTIALGLAVMFLLAFVVPRFAELFSNRGMELPFLTRLLMTVGVILRDQWWAVLIGVVMLVMTTRVLRRTARGAAIIDAVLHRVPHLRRLMVGAAVARFSRVFGLCVGSGLSMRESLDLGARSASRPMLRREVTELIACIGRGERLSAGLANSRYLPRFARRLLAAGEESAQLQRMCDVVARHYDRETKHLASTSATVIEPVLIATLTGVVLVVALAIFVPMWDLAGLVG